MWQIIIYINVGLKKAVSKWKGTSKSLGYSLILIAFDLKTWVK